MMTAQARPADATGPPLAQCRLCLYMAVIAMSEAPRQSPRRPDVPNIDAEKTVET
jgi:hypothetical protein